MTPLLPVVDGDLVLFAESEDGQVVGWLPGIPNLNEALIHAGGLRYPWNHLLRTRAPRSRGEAFLARSATAQVLPQVHRAPLR